MYALLGVNTKFQSSSLPMMKEVIEAQKAYCESDPLAGYVDTANVTIANPYHFDAAGTIEVGRRFATALDALRSSFAVSPEPVVPESVVPAPSPLHRTSASSPLHRHLCIVTSASSQRGGHCELTALP